MCGKEQKLMPQIVWRAPTGPRATIGCWLYTVEVPSSCLEKEVWICKVTVITVLYFCFLSDSPLDSHVNMRTYMLQTEVQPTENPLPSQRLAPFISQGFGQRHTLSVPEDTVLLFFQWSVSSFSMGVALRCFKDGIARRQTVSVLFSWISSVPWT